jgi:hypothetical protein
LEAQSRTKSYVIALYSRHNDLPWNIRKFLHNRLQDFRFGEDLRKIVPWSSSPWSHTDLPRLQAGLVAAQVSTLYMWNLVVQWWLPCVSVWLLDDHTRFYNKESGP